MGQLKLIVLLLLAGAYSCQTHASTSHTLSPAITTVLVDRIVQRRFTEFVDTLGTEGLDVDQPDTKGRLPLLEAVRARDIRYVDALLQHGAHANSKDAATGQAPITLAFQRSMLEIARLLLAYGADINIADKTGFKPRDYAPTMDVHSMIAKWDQQGPAGFEDPPGTWVRVPLAEGGDAFYYNPNTLESRWGTPPSCAWERDVHDGHITSYTNRVTGQTVLSTPPALAWRFVRQEGVDLWYNWHANVTQHDPPGEVSEQFLEELKLHKNVRWYNVQTGAFSWEDPLHAAGWRRVEDTEGRMYFHNVETGASQWDLPVELAWQEVVSEDDPKERWWVNTVTEEATWDPPAEHAAWIRHDSDL